LLLKEQNLCIAKQEPKISKENFGENYLWYAYGFSDDLKVPKVKR